ncbi:hypothetical protein ACE6H2_010005 [Prunus campanulata]
MRDITNNIIGYGFADLFDITLSEMAGHHGIKLTTSSGWSLRNSWHRWERRVLLDSIFFFFLFYIKNVFG